jgi:hypothetical protein
VRQRLVQLLVLTAAAFLVVAIVVPNSARAQAANDTSCVSPLRPRYGSYLLQPYPSPSSAQSPVTIQFYNHNPEILSVKIYDLTNRLMLVVHDKQQTDAGLHTYTLKPTHFASGTYFIRLTTYTPSGAENTVDNIRFVIVH